MKRLFYRRTLPLWLQRARARSLTVGITYHRFETTPGADPLSGMATTPERFAQHIVWLREVGRIVSIDQALRPPEQPGIRFFVCFDDGYADNATILPAIAERLDLPCTLFLTTDFVRGALPALPHDTERGVAPPAMSVSEARHLAAQPWCTIGCHTATHPRLTRFDSTTWPAECQQAKAWLEQNIVSPVRHFAFPFGAATDFDWRHGAAHLLQADFRSVASNFGGSNPPFICDALKHHNERLSHLRRVPMPNTGEREVFLGWVLGWANPRAALLPKNFLNAASCKSG